MISVSLDGKVPENHKRGGQSHDNGSRGRKQSPLGVNQKPAERRVVSTTESSSEPTGASALRVMKGPLCYRPKDPKRTNHTVVGSQRMTSFQVGVVVKFKGHPHIRDDTKAVVYYINKEPALAGVKLQAGMDMNLSGVPRKTFQRHHLLLTEVKYLKIVADAGRSFRASSKKAFRHSEGQVICQNKDRDSRKSTEALMKVKARDYQDVLTMSKKSEHSGSKPQSYRMSVEGRASLRPENTLRKAIGEDLHFCSVASDYPFCDKPTKKKTAIPKHLADSKINKRSKDSGLAGTRESSRTNVCPVPKSGTGLLKSQNTLGQFL